MVRVDRACPCCGAIDVVRLPLTLDRPDEDLVCMRCGHSWTVPEDVQQP